jgi:hypothetical protein
MAVKLECNTINAPVEKRLIGVSQLPVSGSAISVMDVVVLKPSAVSYDEQIDRCCVLLGID